MEYRPLGRTGLQVSVIGLGCVTFGREIEESAAGGVLERALELGINLLDTADSYGDGESERILGRLLQRPGVRERVLVCSKVGGDLSADRILRSAETSLNRLGLATLDLYLLHNYDSAHPLEESLGALQELVERGQVRCVGCSNFSAEQVARAREIQRRRGWAALAVVEPMYNLVARGIEKELLPLCGREGIGVLAYSPLGAGFLTGKYRPDLPLPEGTRFAIKPGHCRHYFYPRSFAFLAELHAIAAAAGVPATRLALAWVLTRPGITTMLIGARSSEQVDQAWVAWTQREPLASALQQLTEKGRGFAEPAAEAERIAPISSPSP